MRALLVTSRVTFVPENYDDLVIGLARCPHVAGLLELDNASLGLVAKALGVIAMGAPRTGWTLLRNALGTSPVRRRLAYRRAGKPVWRLPTINDARAHALIRRGRFDLVINARTRVIYRETVLSLPPLGCLNIHHGLLPDQRGTMCDLWALAEGRAAGFSMHRMTARVDDGEIVLREVVSDGRDRDYMAYLRRAARLECERVWALLDKVAQRGAIASRPNRAPARLRYRRNPDLRAVWAMKRRGMLL